MLKDTVRHLPWPKDVLNQVWSVGLLNFIAGAVLALCSPKSLRTEVVVSLLIGIAATHICLILRRIITKASEEARELLKSLSAEQRIGIERKAHELQEHYLQWLANMVMEQAKEFLIELTNVQELLPIRAHTDGTIDLCETMKSLGCKEEVFAVCTGKPWGSVEMQNYAAANVEALNRGCVMTRIFVENGSFTQEQLKIIERLSQAGATILVLPHERFLEITRLNQLSEGYGYLVANKKVIVHRGRESREAMTFTSPFAVAAHLRLFARLRQASTLYQRRQKAA